MSAVGFWYLATPYSKYAAGLDAAWHKACEGAAALLRAGVPVYSPIAHTHPIALAGDIDPLDHALWLPADEPMMYAACGLVVYEMDGWRDSYGIGVEIETFRRLGKPVVHWRPGAAVPLALLVHEDDADARGIAQLRSAVEEARERMIDALNLMDGSFGGVLDVAARQRGVADIQAAIDCLRGVPNDWGPIEIHVNGEAGR